MRALRLVNHDLPLLLRMCWLLFHFPISLTLGSRLAILTLLRICQPIEPRRESSTGS